MEVALVAILGTLLGGFAVHILTRSREGERRRKDLLLDAYHSWATSAKAGLEREIKLQTLILDSVRKEFNNEGDEPCDYTEQKKEAKKLEELRTEIRKQQHDGAVKLNLLEGNEEKMKKLESLTGRLQKDIPSSWHLIGTADFDLAGEGYDKALEIVNQLNSDIDDFLSSLAKERYLI